MEIQPQFSHEWTLAALNSDSVPVLNGFLSTVLAGDDVRQLEILFHPLQE
jgi:hypothetical protein